jgi:hypothetical protein
MASGKPYNLSSIYCHGLMNYYRDSSEKYSPLFPEHLDGSRRRCNNTSAAHMRTYVYRPRVTLHSFARVRHVHTPLYRG